MKSFFFLIFLVTLLAFSCRQDDPSGPDENIDYRGEMRTLVMHISEYAKNSHNNFFIIPQNGQELLTSDGEVTGSLEFSYTQAIDATGREDMFFGYDDDNKATPSEEKQYLLAWCRLYEQNNIDVLATDYCSTTSKMDSSYAWNEQNGFISFAAPERDLNVIPSYPAKPFHENSEDVTTISAAKNFLYLINSENFVDKKAFIDAVSATNYDIILMDLFHNEVAYTASEISQLQTKKNGGKRLVICYMSIGEAEDYRFYWKNNWKSNKPAWLGRENPEWEGNYKVRYWDPEWQAIIFGNDTSYLKKIIDAGFDGVYLDLIDAFEYFEN